MYTLLSKSIYFKPTRHHWHHLKPPELIHNPEKPFNFTHSLFIRFSPLQLSLPFLHLLTSFDYQSDGFQLGSVCKGKRLCVFLHSSLLFFSFFLSFFLCHSQQRATPLPKGNTVAPGENCFSQHKSPRDRQKKKVCESEEDKAEEEEEAAATKEGESGVPVYTKYQLRSHTHKYTFLNKQMTPGGKAHCLWFPWVCARSEHTDETRQFLLISKGVC